MNPPRTNIHRFLMVSSVRLTRVTRLVAKGGSNMLLHQSSNSRRRAGFTLMEMLIVVAIIVALAGISVVSYFAVFETSKNKIATSQIKSLTVACDTYRLDNKVNPESLNALLQKDPLGNR